MHEATKVISALPVPRRIGRLAELAYNLWWSWNADAVRLLSSIDPAGWNATSHNPVKLLRSLPAARFEQLASDPAFTAQYDAVIAHFDHYMTSSHEAWFPSKHPGEQLLVAYFCAEYGLHESLPIYSGGLGVLAGDHCKTASDLAIPFVAVGLWYTQGYFKQIIDPSGQQIAAPDHVDQSDAPLQFAGQDGADLIIDVPCADSTISARVWRLQVGRVPVYLLDVDIPQNSAADRALCSRLYGGDKDTRIAQEVVLGVGGVIALRALGIDPTCWHMNEGHAGFMALERVRELVALGKTPEEARTMVAGRTLFTTHTPVPAGNEVFPADLVLKYLPHMPAGMGLDIAGFRALAREENAPDWVFAMTPLALRVSHRANGVSSLHGSVARTMWAKQFPNLKVDDVPITSVTNGVHTATWVAPDLSDLLAKYLGPDWTTRVDDPAIWAGLDRVPDEELWKIHIELKTRLLRRASERQIGMAQLDPQALTIGFARRFATYKRATLFFHDMDRARRILTDPARPVQLVFAGKAHPADGGGQALIQRLVGISHDDVLASHVAVVPGYDIGVARALVRGVDVWLNNPERPQEASGTSGQKAALNGIPNCSIRDGWWDEGFDGRNGWAFGGEFGNDDVDSAQLYDVLETSVIPAYYEHRDGDLPRRWTALMKDTIRTCAPVFSTNRMVKEYTERLYL